MFGAMFDLARPLLFALGPEEAHELTLKSLELGFYPRPGAPDHPSLATSLWGLEFPNPLAIAAGFDKDARVPDAVLGLGCGFAEVGTTTPRPQAGNARPRIYRLYADRGVINRLGFNNAGHAAALARLGGRSRRGIVGVNIGANKDSSDRTGDYVLGLEAFYDVASYFTVNISSPNTPGLRDLQAPEALGELLTRLFAARAKLVAAGKPKRPVIVKVAPDIAEEDIAPIAATLLREGVDGIAISNTTLSRPSLTAPDAGEAGGLSGRPLFHRSTVMLARFYQATAGRVPLIGIGGVDSGAAAVAKIEAGASLIQLYTGLIFEGVGLIRRIKGELVEAAQAGGVAKVRDLTGIKAEEWAAKPLA